MSYSLPSFANTPSNAGILDDVLKRYADASSQWGQMMLHQASYLFWGLALLSMVWTYGMMSLRKADPQEFLAETVRFLAVTGFFWWLLVNGPQIAISLIDSLRLVAGQATGMSDKLAPSGIVDIGFDIFFRVLDQSSVWSPIDSLCGLFMGATILIILTLVGINMLLLLISSWLLAYGGIFFLGFGGARWTSDIAINYYRTVLGVGAQLMAMVLLIGIGKSFIDQYYQSLDSGVDLKQMAVMMVVAIILLVLTEKIPHLLAGILHGGGGGSHAMGMGAGTLLGAAGMAVAAAGTAGATAVAGLTQAAGGASALKAAFQAAQQNMASGGGMFAGSNPEESRGGLASAMGTAGRFAADMASHLSHGMGSVTKAKVSAMSNQIKEGIRQTVGGKTAAAIRERAVSQAAETAETAENSTANTFENGNGISAGNNNGHDEVTNFVQRNSGA